MHVIDPEYITIIKETNKAYNDGEKMCELWSITISSQFVLSKTVVVGILFEKQNVFHFIYQQLVFDCGLTAKQSQVLVNKEDPLQR